MTQPDMYLYFYLMGRRDEELPCSIDLKPVADRMLAGEKLRDIAHDVAERAAAAAELDGYQTAWLRDFKEEIEEAGGDAKRAYAQYRMAQIDELAGSLETEILQHVEDILDDIDLTDRADSRREEKVDDDDDDDDDDDEPVDDDEDAEKD